jgi:hypothetical protein
MLASVAKTWLLKGLIAIGETSAWVGAPGSLKSAILTLLACYVAAGKDWCGKRNKGKRAVIYIALERADLVRRRQRVFGEESKVDDLPFVVVANTISFMDEAVVAEIVATIDKVEAQYGIKAGLIILDTLAKTIAAGGGDEDKARDQGKVYANIARIKEQRKVHFAIACHPGKDESKGVSATIVSNNDGATGLLAGFKPKIVSFGEDEDGDQMDVCVAEVMSDEVTASGATKDKTWAKSLTVFHGAFTRMLESMGCDQRPWLDGPIVRAVETKWVREEFFKSWPIEHDKTPDQQRDAKKAAYKRAIKDAIERKLIMVRTIEGIEYVWPI